MQWLEENMQRVVEELTPHKVAYSLLTHMTGGKNNWHQLSFLKCANDYQLPTLQNNLSADNSEQLKISQNIIPKNSEQLVLFSTPGMSFSSGIP